MPPIASICRSGIPAAPRADAAAPRAERRAPTRSVDPGPVEWPHGFDARDRSPPGPSTTHPARRRRHVVTTESTVPSPEIEALFAEERKFPPSPEFVAQANVDAQRLRGGGARLRGVLGEARPRADLVVRAVREDARVGPALREVVRRRQAERRLQLRRPARRERPRQQGRLSLDRRARRHEDDHVRRPPARGEQDRQRPARAGDPDRRSRRDLHADDPRAADRDARVRADRRAAHRRLRRLLGGGALGRIQDSPGEARHHRRRRLAARQAGRPQAGRRRGTPDHARRSSTCSSRDASATPSRAARR